MQPIGREYRPIKAQNSRSSPLKGIQKVPHWQQHICVLFATNITEMWYGFIFIFGWGMRWNNLCVN